MLSGGKNWAAEGKFDDHIRSVHPSKRMERLLHSPSGFSRTFEFPEDETFIASCHKSGRQAGKCALLCVIVVAGFGLLEKTCHRHRLKLDFSLLMQVAVSMRMFHIQFPSLLNRGNGSCKYVTELCGFNNTLGQCYHGNHSLPYHVTIPEQQEKNKKKCIGCKVGSTSAIMTYW